jgi:riboflavin synthase
MDIIDIHSDCKMVCSEEGCTVSMGLTDEGAKMALDKGVKCRRHGLLLVRIEGS